MNSVERANRLLWAAQASYGEIRSILRLEQIATKGVDQPNSLTAAEVSELCKSVIRHLTRRNERQSSEHP